MRTLSFLAPLALAGLLLCSSPQASAQDLVAHGFALDAQQPVPALGAAHATLASGERIVFDGLTVDLYDAAGQFVMTLASLPSFVFPSFVALPPSETFALIGENSNGDVFRVDVAGGGLTFLARLNFNFDAAFLDESNAAISAALCGFGCGNDLLRLNVTTGSVLRIASVPGASGPVAVGPGGDLYYATISGEFPPPPGSTEIVRWSAAQVFSGAVLSLGNATPVAGGLDGAGGLDVDPVLGGVAIAESVFGATSYVKLFSAGGALVSTVITSSSWISNVELRQGAGLGHFHPYQPEDGVFLHYVSSDTIHTIRPERPQAAVTQQGSVATVTVTGAHPDSAVLLLYGPQGLWSPNESTYTVPALGFQFHSGLPPSAFGRLPFLTPTDATGTAVFNYFDPGNLSGTLVFQALVMDASGTFQGLSTGGLN